MTITAAYRSTSYANPRVMGGQEVAEVTLAFSSETYATGGIGVTEIKGLTGFDRIHMVEVMELRKSDTVEASTLAPEWDEANQLLKLTTSGASAVAELANATDIDTLELTLRVWGRGPA